MILNLRMAKFPTNGKVQLSVQVYRETAEELEAVARATGSKVAVIVRSAINDWLDAYAAEKATAGKEPV